MVLNFSSPHLSTYINIVYLYFFINRKKILIYSNILYVFQFIFYNNKNLMMA